MPWSAIHTVPSTAFNNPYMTGMCAHADTNLLYLIGSMFAVAISTDSYIATYDGSTFNILKNLTTDLEHGTFPGVYATPIYSFNDLLFFGLHRRDDNNDLRLYIYSYDPVGDSYTQEYEFEYSLRYENSIVGQFITYNDELYAILNSNNYNATVLKRVSGPDWYIVNNTLGTTNSEMAVYRNNLVLSKYTGSYFGGGGYGEVYQFDGVDFTIPMFQGAVNPALGGPIGFSDIEYTPQGMVELGGKLFYSCGTGIHVWDQDAETLSSLTSHNTSLVQQFSGPRSGVVFDGNATISYPYADTYLGNNSAGVNQHEAAVDTYDSDAVAQGWLSGGFYEGYAPTNLTVYKNMLYAFGITTIQSSFSPSEYLKYGNVLYRWSASETPLVEDTSIRVIGLSKSKGGADIIYVTVWVPDALYLRVYDGTTLNYIRQLYLGPATQTQLNNYRRIAYPYVPPNVDACYIHGNFSYNGGSHVAYTIDNGATMTVIENSWGNDVCGALRTLAGQVYCVRNKSQIGQLYRGVNSLQYVSTIDFPVNVNTLKFNDSGNILIAGSRLSGTNERVMLSIYPFNTWLDTTLNYPTTNQVTSIVPL